MNIKHQADCPYYSPCYVLVDDFWIFCDENFFIDIPTFSGIFPVMDFRRIWFLIIFLGLVSGACALPKAEGPNIDIETTHTPVVEVVETQTLVPSTTPAPTLVPAVRIENADRAFSNGDWEMAYLEYQRAQQSDSDPEIQAASILGMGRTRHQMGQLQESLDTLHYLLESFPESPLCSAAYFELAQVYEALSLYEAASGAYMNYLALKPGLIDGYINDWRGDVLVSAGDYIGAIDAYQNALSSQSVLDPLGIQVKIANTYAVIGDLQTALVAYQDIYTRTTNDYTKAQMDFLMGQTYTALGQMDEAYSVYLDAVTNYPLAYDSYQALITLVDTGYPVSEFDRGLVDYFAGQYALSIAAFDRYLSESSENAGTAYYYKGLAYLSLDNPGSAIDSWDVLIQSYLADENWDDAWEEKAYTQWAYLDQYDLAVETLLDFVHDYPWHERAPEFLFDAARIAERSGDLELAAGIWERVPPEYPSSSFVHQAIFLAGISYYRAGDYTSALATFEWFLGSSADPADKSAAYFWIAKTYQITGNDSGAKTFWSNAANEDPTGYYSELARDLLIGRDPFEPPVMFDLGVDNIVERESAEAWMRTNFGIPEGVDLLSLGDLVNDPRLSRGTELWNLGQYELAQLEFELLRTDILQSPSDNFRLAIYLADLGLYRSAIFMARQVLNLDGMDDAQTLTAPIFFNHLRFGTFYKELILPVSDAYGFNPLFIYSVVRQESLFEGFVRSSVGARGLMQIMPGTGEGIVVSTGWPPGYTAEDLYLPNVNITLGTDYLDSQRTYFNGDLYAALAAYNAGPGNSGVWLEFSQGDMDLFLEIIRFEETQNYIKGIYEVFTIYRRIYDRSP